MSTEVITQPCVIWEETCCTLYALIIPDSVKESQCLHVKFIVYFLVDFNVLGPADASCVLPTFHSPSTPSPHTPLTLSPPLPPALVLGGHTFIGARLAYIQSLFSNFPILPISPIQGVRNIYIRGEGST